MAVKSGRAVLVGPMFKSEEDLSGVIKSISFSSKDYVVAIDRGVEICAKAGLRPDMAVGDWDSIISRQSLIKVPHITLPRDKDRSDTFYAACAATNLRCNLVKELVCIGVTGGRGDHHLATLFDLSELSSSGHFKRVCAIDNDCEYHFLSDKIKSWDARLKVGQIVSVFAFGGQTKGVLLSGFKYQVRGRTLSPSSHGLSNLATGKRCHVKLKEGRLVVLMPKNLYA
ncbi:MAG: thiamine diphosphokinase [Bdellovibrionota bacterium]